MRLTLWSPDRGDVPANIPLTNNFAATTDPTVNDDTTRNYTPGARWINTADGRAFTLYDATAGAAVWIVDAQSEGLAQQPAPTAKTVSSTLTAAQIQAGIITVNQGAGAASAQQLPTAAAMDAAFPNAVANSSFDFTVINTSTVDAEDASITTNTGWTLVGSMDVPANSAAGSLNTSGRFRARKTAAGAWTLYRIS